MFPSDDWIFLARVKSYVGAIECGGRHVRLEGQGWLGSPVASNQLIILSLFAGYGQANGGPRLPYAAHRDGNRTSKVAKCRPGPNGGLGVGRK